MLAPNKSKMRTFCWQETLLYYDVPQLGIIQDKELNYYIACLCDENKGFYVCAPIEKMVASQAGNIPVDFGAIFHDNKSNVFKVECRALNVLPPEPEQSVLVRIEDKVQDSDLPERGLIA